MGRTIPKKPQFANFFDDVHDQLSQLSLSTCQTHRTTNFRPISFAGERPHQDVHEEPGGKRQYEPAYGVLENVLCTIDVVTAARLHVRNTSEQKEKG